MPIAEAGATASFTNFVPSVPKMIDQIKFVNNQFCTISDYTITECTSQEKDKRKELVTSRENEVQEYCDGQQQQIVDPSSATISTTYVDQKRSNNICGKGNSGLNQEGNNGFMQQYIHYAKEIDNIL